MQSFVHLHVHSHYSILDGMSSVSGLVDKAMKTGMNAIALTDHGNMFGIKEFFDYTKKKNDKTKKEISEIEKQIADIEKGEISVANKEAELTSLQEKLSATKKKLFKPILGCEAYVARRTRFDKSEKQDGSGHHLVILAKNKKGYHNLCKLVSAGWIDGYYYRPRIDKDLLEKYSEGLIIASACLGGEIHKKIEVGNLQEAEESVMWFKNIFGDDYYLELQRHQTNKVGANTHTFEKQTRQNEELIKLARKTNTKLIATNDVHFVEEEHAEGHDRLICLSTGKDLDDPNRMRYTKQEWLKTPKEMFDIFADIPEAIQNTLEIADKIEYYSIDSDAIMPMYPISKDFGTEDDYKTRFTEEDLRKEFGDRFDKLGGANKLYRIKLEADYLKKITLEGAKKRYGEEINPDIMDRILFELDVMKTMGFPGYFLIVQDFIQAARDMGVSVGPGRGSAAGSVVAYCLKITDIDPLKYDLLFERFLNPDRISMPDIDIDFDDDGRGEVLRWVTEKYGKEKVAHIITYGTMATKSSIKDVARVQKLPLSEADRLTKLIPDKFPEENGKAPKINITNCIERVPELREARFSNDENLSNTLKYAEMLEGTVRQTGIHACGVIIGAEDLTFFTPLSTAKDKETGEEVLVTQYEGSVIENVGLIKMDFLGLKTLSIIKEALSNIKKSRGIDIDIDLIPIDDEITYQLYSKGLTTGTFQFESAGMQQHLRNLQPTKFEDLIAMNALYRPGPMQYIPSFINRKHGREEIQYDFPVMENRLKETYGITVYQEQVMLLSRDLAGFTRGESDELRKAMGKKLIDKMEALKVKFMNGAIKNGFGPKEKLEKIWSDWSEFAKYAFNKSHATCYSWISYQTAYLKAHYPGEFMAANLTRNKDDITEITKFMDECRNLGIIVMGPDVNESNLNFTTNKNGNIRFGLGGVKGVGAGAVEQIIKERETNGAFIGIFDFIERVNLSACNRKNIEGLALAGAFDNFPEIKREQFFAVNSKGEQFSEILIKYGNRVQADNNLQKNSLFGDDDNANVAKPEIPQTPEWSTLEKLNKERELVGIYISAHPLDNYKFEINHVCNTSAAELKEGLELFKDRGEIRIGGMVTTVRHARTKADKPCGFFTLEDYSGGKEFALFGEDYLNFNKYMQKDLYLLITGKVQERGADWKFKPKTESNYKEYEFKIQKIIMLPDAKENLVEKVTIKMDIENINDSFCTEFLEITKTNPGKILLYFNVTDANNKVNLFARDRKISLSKNVMKFLEKNEKQEIFELKIN
jgi:DNA polymerase-3 subunit alpha